MLENIVFNELWSLLDSSVNIIFAYSPSVNVPIYRSEQLIEDFNYPSMFVSFLDPVVDTINTPLNEILAIVAYGFGFHGFGEYGFGDSDTEYEKGVVVRQSIDLLLYDNDIKRIAQLQNQLFLWLKQHLALTDVTIFNISPPLMLDFTEENYVYKRNIEIVCKYKMSWEEIAYTIETFDYTLTVTE